MFQAVLKPYLNEWSSNHAVTVTTQLSINIAGCCRRNVHLQWGSHIPLFNLGLRFEIKECEFSFLPYLSPFSFVDMVSFYKGNLAEASTTSVTICIHPDGG